MSHNIDPSLQSILAIEQTHLIESLGKLGKSSNCCVPGGEGRENQKLKMMMVEREREREREKFFFFVVLDYFSFDQFFCLSLIEFTDFYSLATFLS